MPLESLATAVMASNGDERQAAAWERVEASLDRLREDQRSRFEAIDGRFDALGAQLGSIEDRQLKDAHATKLRFDELTTRVAHLDAELDAV